MILKFKIESKIKFQIQMTYECFLFRGNDKNFENVYYKYIC